MSCLSPDALSHFEQREQELLALNQQLERRRAQAPSEAPGAAGDAEPSPPHDRQRPPPAEDGPPPDAGAAGGSRAPEGDPSEQAAGAAAPRASPPRTPGVGGAAAEAAEASLRTTARLQSARIAALQEELDRTIAELAGRDGENRRLKQELKQLSDDNARLQKAAPGEGAVERLRKQLAGAEARLGDLEAERAELLRVRDQLELQAKRHAAEDGAKEARLSRLGEECEKQRQAAREAGGQDKERAAADRKELERLSGEVRKLERQRAELVAAFRKQMRLVDVLKRQRAHMEAARVLSFTEDEFIRILELGDKLGE